MAKFKVTLTFIYDSDESIADWQGDYPVEFITTEQEAKEVARVEMDNASSWDFEFEAETLKDK